MVMSGQARTSYQTRRYHLSVSLDLLRRHHSLSLWLWVSPAHLHVLRVELCLHLDLHVAQLLLLAADVGPGGDQVVALLQRTQ